MKETANQKLAVETLGMHYAVLAADRIFKNLTNYEYGRYTDPVVSEKLLIHELAKAYMSGMRGGGPVYMDQSEKAQKEDAE